MAKIMSGSGDMTEAVDSLSYEEIENQISPMVFYGLLSTMKGDKFKSGKKGFTVASYHHVFMEMLLRKGIVRANESAMVRATTGIGLMAKASLVAQPEYKELTHAIINNSQGYRKVDNMSRLKRSLSRVDLSNESAKNHLRLLIESYGDNIYGEEIWKAISSWDDEKPRIKKRERYVPELVKQRCFKLTMEGLTSNMYRLKRNSNNQSLEAYFSERFFILAHRYCDEFLDNQTMSEFFRGCFVAGLYCLAKWVLKNEISPEEYDFFRLIQEIDSYAAKS